MPDTDVTYSRLNDPFDKLGADWVKVRANCLKFVCFASDNDPYVPLDHARDFADKLGAEFIIIPNGGHLNADSGFTRFPQLLSAIRHTLQT